MQILQVSPYYSPQLGGSPQVVYQMSRELSRRGHNVTVLASDYGIHQGSFPAEAFRTTVLPTVFSRWGFYYTPAIISWCRKYISRFDVIHLHEVRTFQNIIIYWFAVRSKIPYVLSSHGTLPVIVQRKIAKRVYDLLFGCSILASASHLVAVSRMEVEQYRQAGVEDRRICLLYNGLDLNEFASLPPRGMLRNKIGINSHHKVVLYLGRLHIRKGVNHLIEAFAKLQYKDEDHLLLIAGPDEGVLERLKTLTRRIGIQEQVRFLGPVYGEDRLAAYVDADVLVNPAVHEIFGLVPFEALLCGTPVIVANDCGAGQLISEAHAGYTVPYGDADALASVIERAITNRKEAKQMVKQGQAFIRKYLDWKNIVNELENLYQDSICEYVNFDSQINRDT